MRPAKSRPSDTFAIVSKSGTSRCQRQRRAWRVLGHQDLNRLLAVHIQPVRHAVTQGLQALVNVQVIEWPALKEKQRAEARFACGLRAVAAAGGRHQELGRAQAGASDASARRA